MARDDMLRVVAFAESEKTIAGLPDAALITLMSDCLLRISEAVAVNVGDLHKNTLRIKSSKTDQEGLGEVLYVGGPTLKLIDRYCARAEIEDGASVINMQNAGRWQSPQMPAHYAKAEFAERGAVARFFYGKAK